MNNQRLAEVADAILADPKSYNQDFFFSKVKDIVGTTGCGSTQCICGRGIVMYHHNGKKIEQQWLTENLQNYEEIWQLGREIFDIDAVQAERLFSEVPEDYFAEQDERNWSKENYQNWLFDYAGNVWPYEFSLRYIKAESGQERAQIAYDRIHHFINTNGAE